MNPIGIAISEITHVSVPPNANVTSPTVMFLGKSRVVDESIRSTVEDPKRNRMKVPNVQMSKFRLFCDFAISFANLVRDRGSVVGGYLGRLGLALSNAR